MLGYQAGDDLTTGSDNICIGYLTDTASSSRAQSITIGNNIDSLGDNEFTFGKSGNRVYNNFATNASWTRSSDERLKTNIQDDTLGLDFISRLQPRTFQWKPSNEVPQTLTESYNEINKMDTSVVMNGFIAQEVKQALDDSNAGTQGIWSTQPDGTQSLSRDMMIMPLVNAIKELKTELDAAKARIATLEAG